MIFVESQISVIQNTGQMIIHIILCYKESTVVLDDGHSGLLQLHYMYVALKNGMYINGS